MFLCHIQFYNKHTLSLYDCHKCFFCFVTDMHMIVFVNKHILFKFIAHLQMVFENYMILHSVEHKRR